MVKKLKKIRGLTRYDLKFVKLSKELENTKPIKKKFKLTNLDRKIIQLDKLMHKQLFPDEAFEILGEFFKIKYSDFVKRMIILLKYGYIKPKPNLVDIATIKKIKKLWKKRENQEIKYIG
jgi:hypothetical protein